MRKLLVKAALVCMLAGCNRLDTDEAGVYLVRAAIDENTINTSGAVTGDLPVDRPVTLSFSGSLDPASVSDAFGLYADNVPADISASLLPDQKTVLIYPSGLLRYNTLYRLVISSTLAGSNRSAFAGQEFSFKTQAGSLQVQSLVVTDAEKTVSGRTVNVPLDFQATIEFSGPVDQLSLIDATRLNGPEAPTLTFAFNEEGNQAVISGTASLNDLSRYSLVIGNTLSGAGGGSFSGLTLEFYTRADETPKFPLISDEELLSKVQQQTFKYFWDFAHERSGLARERNTSGNLVTTGGSGFGAMAILVGIERGFISRQQGVERWTKMVDFLGAADRFHGAWPHWLDGETGRVVPFSARDNGGDLVETAFLIQGLLAVKAYLEESNPAENSLIAKITQLWHEVEWNWYTRGNQDVLYWHWSPEYNWEINLPVSGYNESLIVYVLAAASPTYPIEKRVYDNGWARGGNMGNGGRFYGYLLPLGEDFGGPLFFAHYSFLGLDPRNLSDQYANYWEQNRNHALINQAHSIQNPSGYVGYSENNWGLTASDNPEGYSAHSPTNDKGVITPTAALASFPYTPEESMKALKFFYYTLGDRLWGEYGFYDAFNITQQWYASSYLAIDQGPIIVMIENYRTGRLWDLFMTDPDVKNGLNKLGFRYN